MSDKVGPDRIERNYVHSVQTVRDTNRKVYRKAIIFFRVPWKLVVLVGMNCVCYCATF